jgi:preprotein translocase subunit SecB
MEKDKSEIRVEIYNAKPLLFKVHRDEEVKEGLTVDNVSLELNVEFQVDQKESIVAVKLNIEVQLKKNNENLFELISLFEFGVFNLQDVLVEKKEDFFLKTEFARKLLNICIGGSRGMLSVLLSSTPYHNFTLPIANISDDLFVD